MTAAPGSNLERIKGLIAQRRDPDARLDLEVSQALAVRVRKATYDEDLKALRQAAAAGDDGEKRLHALAHYVAAHVTVVLAVDGDDVVPLYADGSDAELDERLAGELGVPFVSKPDLLRHVVGDGAVDELAGHLSAFSGFEDGSVKTLQGESRATRR